MGKMPNPNLEADIQILKNSLLFSRLNDEQLTVLAAKLRLIVFKRNQVIFVKDDPGEALYIIRNGRVKISVPSSEGKDLTINIYGEAEVFGEMSVFDRLPRSADAIALTRVEALVLNRSSFEELLNSVPGLAASIITLLSRRLRYTTEQTEMLVLLGAYDRVALKLLQISQEDADGLLSVNLSQQELGAMLGLTREWINKVLGAFADQGAIEVSRGKIILLKPDMLRN
jgi:CRP/FNR family transcriptional regulator/CRP/FNR family cyclic AMP-dependent transcriptional regulator